MLVVGSRWSSGLRGGWFRGRVVGLRHGSLGIAPHGGCTNKFAELETNPVGAAVRFVREQLQFVRAPLVGWNRNQVAVGITVMDMFAWFFVMAFVVWVVARLLRAPKVEQAAKKVGAESMKGAHETLTTFVGSMGGQSTPDFGPPPVDELDPDGDKVLVVENPKRPWEAD